MSNDLINTVILKGGFHDGVAVKIKGYPDHIKMADHEAMTPYSLGGGVPLRESMPVSIYVRKEVWHPRNSHQRWYEYVLEKQQ